MSGISPQTNSDLLALARGSAQDISSVLDRLLSRGEAPSQVASVVEQLIDAGRPVPAIHLAKVLVAAGSPTLYNKVRSTLLADNRSLLILYKGGYPDPEIERRLSGTLYDIAENDANPLRREIANAIHDVGSVETLPVLEAIVFDHTPTLKAKQVIANAIDAVGVSNADAILRAIEVRSKSEFLRIVAEAIAAVKNRGSSLPFSPQQTFLTGDGDVPFAVER